MLWAAKGSAAATRDGLGRALRGSGSSGEQESGRLLATGCLQMNREIVPHARDPVAWSGVPGVREVARDMICVGEEDPSKTHAMFSWREVTATGCQGLKAHFELAGRQEHSDRPPPAAGTPAAGASGEGIPPEAHLLVSCPFPLPTSSPSPVPTPCPLEKMNNYCRVVISQYHSGVGANGVRPYQWHLCLETGRDRRGYVEATTFYVQGSPATGFTQGYSVGVRYTTGNAYRGSMVIGEIPFEAFNTAAGLIGQVETAHLRGPYASQEWAYAAVRKLHGHRVLQNQLWSMEFIAKQLRNAEAAWERGDA
ncbi:hypothetical protein C2E23DRAFT_861647 [Lenzites betulinus]|nr:hypothetical protein C2E23DRAFT_861647 [Lenzites betulinus]